MCRKSASKGRVAVVEDDPAVLDSLQFALEIEGYGVWLFETAERALASSDILAADCLVIDYKLPGLDGLTMLGRLRQRDMTCPAIILAGSPSARCRADAKKAGVPVIEKPIVGEKLVGLLRSLLSP